MSDTHQYTHGHHESVLRTHNWRTAANSAAYLLDSLSPNAHILDVGCGPGSITIDLAELVPEGHVTGLEYLPDVLNGARAAAMERGVNNVTFSVGDVHALSYPDNSFDVVHAHQVLQHLHDPIQALREMKRVAKPGGIVAVRETDFAAMTWYPEANGLTRWHELYCKVARANGGEPNAGRQLHAWARKAGFDPANIKKTAGTWCFSSPEDVAVWSGSWSDRVVASSLAKGALDHGYAIQEDLAYISQAWKDWGTQEDAWFAVVHGEILCRV